MRAKHTALLLTAGFLLMPTLLWSQLPGLGAGGAPGGGRMQMDPDQLFNLVSKGQDVIRLDQLDPRAKSMFDRFASSFGLSGNEITREQFRGAMTRVREMAASGQLPGGMNLQGGGGAGPDGDRRLDDRFQRMDRDQDGVLSNDELSETLQGERDKYDANHDGKIDLNEYRAYVNARIGDARPGGDGQRGPGGRGDADAPAEEERKRPTVLRAGNLPRDFPYAALDTNADGQVGLYEWKAAGHRVSEFLPMDPNNDGFLTVEEYYGWRKQSQEEAMKSGSQSGEFARGGGRGSGGMMGMGMPGADRSGRGPGGNPGFGMAGDNRGGGMGGGAPGMMMGGGRVPGGERGGFGGFGMGMQGGGGFGGSPGVGMMGRSPGGFGTPGMGMTGANWGGGSTPGGDRGFGRGTGGFSGAGTGAPSPFPGSGMTPGGVMPRGGGFPQPGVFPPGGMTGFRGDRDADMGGDRGPRMGEDRGPGGRGRGEGGDRGDRPRKDRDR